MKNPFYLLISLTVFSLALPCFAQNNFTPDLIPYRKGEKWGFADKNKKIIIPCEYDNVQPFNAHNLAIVEKNNKYYLMDKTGKILPNTEHGYIMQQSEDLYVVSEKGLDREGIPMGKQGYMDKQGKVVISMQYDLCYRFSDGLAKVRKDGTIGFIDKTGKTVIPFKKYYDAGYFNSGVTWTRNETGYYIIDKTGKEISLSHIKIDEYDGIRDFNEGIAIVKKDGKYGAIDKTGKLIIPIQYSYLSDFSEGLAVVKEKSSEGQGFIDKTGKIVIPALYWYAAPFKNGIAYTEKEDIKEFIDKNNKVIFTISKGEILTERSDEYMWIEYDTGKYMLMDKTGKILFKKENYQYVSPFSNGLAKIGINGKNGVEVFYIDTNGTEYWE